MADPLDHELLELINRLNKIQHQVGGDKKEKDKSSSNGKIDRFVDLKSTMCECVEGLKLKIEMTKNPTSNNPRELIALQSEVRNDLAQLHDQWQELNALYLAESKKRKVPETIHTFHFF
jgi:hypothetical protein